MKCPDVWNNSLIARVAGAWKLWAQERTERANETRVSLLRTTFFPVPITSKRRLHRLLFSQEVPHEMNKEQSGEYTR